MKAEFIEKYDRLKDLQPGEVAVSADREKIFVCAYVPNAQGDDSHKAFFDLNSPRDQYVHQQDMDQKIRKLERGDVFVFTV